jgi:membrane protease YdiL (CAAX protease family)
LTFIRRQALVFGGAIVQEPGSGIGETVQKTRVEWKGTAGICILFSVTILIFVLFGYRVQSRNIHSGIIITEFVLISLPAVLYLVITKQRPGEVLRLNPSKFLNFFVVFWIIIFAIPLAAVFNLINLFIVDAVFGKVVVQSIPVGETGLELLLSILIIAGSAGICEEFLFRGVLQRGFEAFGTAKSILLAAFLFSVMHLDFQKILGTFVLGVLIGFIVYRTNSLFCGMFAHFTNNAIAVLAGYVSNKLSNIFQKSGDMIQPSGSNISEIFELFAKMPRYQLYGVMLIYGFILGFCAVVFGLLVYLLTRLNPMSSARSLIGPEAADAVPAADTNDAGIHGAAANKTKGLLWLIPGFILIGLWFYTQACTFLGIGNGVTEIFRIMTGAV